ncbi:caspase family protein [Myxococcota bacterium]|nr:caspase family protein [Myxococcota bacterium]
MTSLPVSNPRSVLRIAVLTATVAFAAALAATPAPARAAPSPDPGGGSSAAPTPTGLVPITRWALVVGANDGGTDRPRLRFAAADADAFAEVMVRYGGVERGRAVVLREPRQAALREAIAALGRRIGAGTAARSEVVFYYSGHSDEQGLLLAGERLPYGELRAAIEALPAQVRIAVVDSCASGAMIRAKGGERRPAFLVDQANAVRGTAVLASASADEAAQESDRVGASFFSHALLTGLRGAADVTGDDRVTLNEAYQFAFAETLGRTQQSALGPQHASYDIQLVGQGDVVLTDLSAVSARLLLEERIDGRIYVRGAGGALVAELRKPAGRAVQLGLAPGEYEVLVDDGRTKRLGRVTLSDRAPTLLRLEQLAPVAAEVARARGDAGPPPPPESNWGLSVVPGLSTDGEVSRRFSLGVFGAAPDRVDVLGVSTLFNVVEGDSTGLLGSSIFNVTGGRSEGAALSSVFNWADEGGAGFQGSAVLNVANGPFEGVQASSVMNYAGEPLTGVQASSALNLAGDFTGAQLGIINIGGSGTGAQVGIINIGGALRGAQVGLINVARSVEGGSVALIPVVVEGRHHLTVHGGEVVHAAAAYQIGATRTHAFFGVGTRLVGDERLLPFLGLGFHNPLGPGALDIDLLTHAMLDTSDFGHEPPSLHTLRIVYGWQLLSRLAVFAGPTWNAMVSRTEHGTPDLGFTAPLIHRGDEIVVQQWPGAVLGVRM